MDTSKQEHETNIIEVSMNTAMLIAYMVTIACSVVLFTVGTIELVAYPMWHELIYFIGGSISLVAHFAIRLLMPKQ